MTLSHKHYIETEPQLIELQYTQIIHLSNSLLQNHRLNMLCQLLSNTLKTIKRSPNLKLSSQTKIFQNLNKI